MTDIYVVGYPKVGTTWLCRLLGDILNCPVGAINKPSSHKAIATEGQDRPGKHYVGQGHPVPTNEGDSLTPDHLNINLNYLNDQKIILMIRNPRDVCVSAMYHWGIDNIHQAIECVGEGRWPLIHGGGYMSFYEKWARCPIIDDIIFVSYEKLLSEIDSILDRLLIDYDRSRVDKAIERQSFSNRKEWTKQNGDTLNYGREWQLNFLRKGTSGDWKNHFDNKAIRMSEEYFGDYIR